jgi:DNA end-binding protein Ku
MAEGASHQRSMWSGSISFGLVSVPVKLYPALVDRDIHFHLMSKDGTCRLRRRLVCPETGQEYEYKDVTKGYEVAPDEYVIVTDQELSNLKPEASRAIDIKNFVNIAEIDPIYYDRPYFLLPDEHGAKGYRLLVESMARSRKAAIAMFVMRGHEYLAAIRPMSDVLCLETMHFADEIVPPESMSPPRDVKVSAKELEVANRLIGALETEFDPQQYHETYRERVTEFIERKASGKKSVIQTASEPRTTKTTDLMKALEASISHARRETENGRVGRRSHARAGRTDEPRRSGVQGQERRPKSRQRSARKKH